MAIVATTTVRKSIVKEGRKVRYTFEEGQELSSKVFTEDELDRLVEIGSAKKGSADKDAGEPERQDVTGEAERSMSQARTATKPPGSATPQVTEGNQGGGGQ